MYWLTREELQLYWKSIQRSKGRASVQAATAFRVGMHSDKSGYRDYVKGMTTKLEKALDPEDEETQTLAESTAEFFAKVGGTRIQK